MALTYYLYSTGTTYANTVISGSSTSFVPLPTGTSEVLLDFDLKVNQPYYIYQYTGGTTELVRNTEKNVRRYRVSNDDAITIDNFIRYNQELYDYFGQPQATAVSVIEANQSAAKLVVSGLTALTGETQRLDSVKVERVTGATGNLAIFKDNGDVEDSGVTIDSITGGTGYYFYEEKNISQSTTSSSDVVYISASAIGLQAGTWSIDWNALGGNASRNKSIVVGFYLDGVLQGVENRLKSNSATNVMPFVITKDLTLTGGNHTFEVRFRQSGGGTAFLDYAAIRARIVN